MIFFKFVLSYASGSYIIQAVNLVLERELSGYRFVDGIFTDITDEQEVAMLEEALNDDEYPGVKAHLRRALELLSDRENPDYRNSIKESISAVESISKVIAKKPNASLSKALEEIDRRGKVKIHTALREGFMKLYSYTSNEYGIRHAMLDEPDLSADDAKYFLLSCTSFINYLKAKM